ncbi:MAG TPA: hypothetical protein VK613_12695 [Gaiellaceae bacterium]|nr:hypothetical protein [Gaiellaceae bacterium]
MKNGSDSDDLSPPDVLRGLEQSFTGDGLTLDEAFKNAWERGKSSGHRVFRAQDIFVWGDNPISGYRVIITPVG